MCQCQTKISELNIKRIKNRNLEKALPEFYELQKVIENNDYHKNQSVFDHSLLVLEELKKLIKKSDTKIKSYLSQKINIHTRKELLFLAALLHDIGKKETISKRGNFTYIPKYKHENKSAIKTKKILSRFELSEIEKAIIINIIKNHGIPLYISDPQNEKINNQLEGLKINRSDIFLELILLATADVLGSQYKNRTEFEFKINFFKKILNNY